MRGYYCISIFASERVSPYFVVECFPCVEFSGHLYVFADGDSRIAPSAGRACDQAARTLRRAVTDPARVVALQLLAYHAALAHGTDVDKPCNLAKSVMVE
jgi:glucosamine 6-phosphate synthetase-like amidotransferase/phosphosugar isomerase protein